MEKKDFGYRMVEGQDETEANMALMILILRLYRYIPMTIEMYDNYMQYYWSKEQLESHIKDFFKSTYGKQLIEESKKYKKYDEIEISADDIINLFQNMFYYGDNPKNWDFDMIGRMSWIRQASYADIREFNKSRSKCRDSYEKFFKETHYNR